MSENHSFSYRADVDGLRAMAILLVILFHSGVTAITGGFIGVDVFFVISGFLIGGIINKEISNGTFSFTQFYVRRIRRIAPALFFMLLCVSAIGYILLSPLEFRDLAKYITATILSVPNIVLLKGINYFNASSDFNPLLMTWSLGIEEQFYFVLPIILVLASNRKISAIKIVLSITLLSLLASIVLTPFYGRSSFYLLHTRAWELGAGVLLALWRPQPLQGAKNASLTVIGLLLIVVPAFILEKNSVFPGYLALFPVLGTTLVIFSRSQISQLVLENRPMLFIGKVSYSWYLWHWPLLSIARTLADEPLTAIQGLIICALALLVATLSLYLIERPFRKQSTTQGRVIFTYCTLCVIASVSFFSVYLADGLKYRVNDLVNNSEQLKTTALKNPCLISFGPDLPSHNQRCMPDSKVAGIALVGDSHAAALRSAVELYALKKNKPLFEITKAACPFLIGVSSYIITQPSHGDQCRIFNEATMKILLSDKIDEVVITAYWAAGISLSPGYGYRSNDQQVTDNYQALTLGIENAVARLLAAKKRIVIINDAPNLDIDPLRMTNNRNIPIRNTLNTWLTSWSGTPVMFDRTTLFHLTEEKINKILASHAGPGVKVVTLQDNLCNLQGCLISSQGLPLYYDNHHLTAVGSVIALGMKME